MGPTEDGGYYLIGCSQPHPALFQGIAWSTESVFEETIKVANAESLRVAKLDTLRDVDTVEDL